MIIDYQQLSAHRFQQKRYRSEDPNMRMKQYFGTETSDPTGYEICFYLILFLWTSSSTKNNKKIRRRHPEMIRIWLNRDRDNDIIIMIFLLKIS